MKVTIEKLGERYFVIGLGKADTKHINTAIYDKPVYEYQYLYTFQKPYKTMATALRAIERKQGYEYIDPDDIVVYTSFD